MRVAAVQTTAGPDRDENLGAAGALVAEAAASGAELVVLPELFSVAGSPEVLRTMAEDLRGPTLAWATRLAADLSVHILAGSFPERAADGRRVHNTSCLVAPTGALVATYRKVHLFDVDLPGAEVRESATFVPGDDICVAPLPNVPAVLGLSICYDLRFPELYRVLALRGATVVAVPAAFTAVTGLAHWEILLRARAIENETYVVAAGQVGRLPPGMPACHGHSMIVDPWGEIVAVRDEPSPGIVLGDLDLARLARVRDKLPVLAHRRPDAYVWGGEGRKAGVGRIVNTT